jgi:hypothetical protein
MDGFVSILYSVLPPFILLGIGGFARSVGWLKAEADSSLSMITVRLLYPFFIVFHILDSGAKFDHQTITISCIGFISILIGFALSWMISKFLKMDESNARTFRFCSGIFNYGFIAIPVAVALFDEGIVVKIILFNLGVEIAIWTVGILILTSKTFSLRGILNPPAVSVIIALVFQSMGGKALIPSFIWNVIESVAMCSIPIGLLLIGASFYQLMRSFRFSSGFKIEIGAILVRNFLFPMIVLLYICFGYIPDFLFDIREVLIVQAAMPAGIFAVVIVGNYSGEKDTAMRSIIVTMVVSVITLPLWIMYGIYLLP